MTKLEELINKYSKTVLLTEGMNEAYNLGKEEGLNKRCPCKCHDTFTYKSHGACCPGFENKGLDKPKLPPLPEKIKGKQVLYKGEIAIEHTLEEDTVNALIDYLAARDNQ
jgi:hypothetical protein